MVELSQHTSNRLPHHGEWVYEFVGVPSAVWTYAVIFCGFLFLCCSLFFVLGTLLLLLAVGFYSKYKAQRSKYQEHQRDTERTEESQSTLFPVTLDILSLARPLGSKAP